jgi:Tfp pilus assembly protein PilX
MRIFRSQCGVSLIAAIFIIVVLAFMGVMFLSMVNTASLTSVNDLQSAQAFYIAEGGREYILMNRTFPNYSTGGTKLILGAGSFTVDTPAYLTAPVAVNATTINVNSTSGFASPPGRIVVDAEVMNYTGIAPTSFTLPAAGATTAHAAGNAVYPVSRVANVALLNNCSTTDVQADYVTNFIIPGIITIGNEYFQCTGTAAGPARFTGCTRCYKGSSSAAHNITDNIFQYVLTSTGTVGGAQRIVRATVGQ